MNDGIPTATSMSPGFEAGRARFIKESEKVAARSDMTLYRFILPARLQVEQFSCIPRFREAAPDLSDGRAYVLGSRAITSTPATTPGSGLLSFMRHYGGVVETVNPQ